MRTPMARSLASLTLSVERAPPSRRHANALSKASDRAESNATDLCGVIVSVALNLERLINELARAWKQTEARSRRPLGASERGAQFATASTLFQLRSTPANRKSNRCNRADCAGSITLAACEGANGTDRARDSAGTTCCCCCCPSNGSGGRFELLREITLCNNNNNWRPIRPLTLNTGPRRRARLALGRRRSSSRNGPLKWIPRRSLAEPDDHNN